MIKYIIYIVIFLGTQNIYSQRTLEEIQKIYASDPDAGDNFGYTLSISGDLACFGIPFDDTEASNAGTVYFFERDASTGIWNEVDKVTASDADIDDWFGQSVSLSGNFAIIGALFDDAEGSNAGAAYIFERDTSTGTWSEVQKITASDAETEDRFGGEQISISGNYAVVGARFEDSGGSNAGAAYFFERDVSTGIWSEVNKVIGADADDRFGQSVSISGDYAIVGADLENVGAVRMGAAYFYERDASTGIWNEVNRVIASDAETEDRFGNIVSISGNYAVVGAHFEDSQGSDAGAAYFYERDASTGIWSEVSKVTASDAEANDLFGVSLSISGDFAIIGAYNEDSEDTDAGAAYFFERDASNGRWSEVSKITASDAEFQDRFARSVSISGKNTFFGALNEDTQGSNAGAAYFFLLNTPPILNSFNVDVTNNLTANLSVRVDDEGEETSVIFKYGTSSSNYTYQTNPILLTADNLESSETIQISNLIENQTYYAIVEATNSDGTAQSSEVSFVALENINDSDGDGIVDDFEEEGPNNGDGNGDGIQDYIQRSVTTIRDALDNSYITIVSQDNFNLNEVIASLSDDNMFSYPFGKTEFKINTIQAEVKIYYHGIESLDGYVYRKLFPDGTYKEFENVEFTSEIISGNRVAVAILTLTDGGPGDYDGEVNGIIYDPGGPALPISANIPYWSWLYALLLIPSFILVYTKLS